MYQKMCCVAGHSSTRPWQMICLVPTIPTVYLITMAVIFTLENSIYMYNTGHPKQYTGAEHAFVVVISQVWISECTLVVLR